MPETNQRPTRHLQEITEAVSVHTNRIEDACIDKDCIEDLRVYLTTGSQAALDGAVSGRAVGGELLHVQTAVKPISFNPGHFAIDLTYYFRISGEVMAGQVRPTPIEGLSVFNKRVVLCGSSSAAKTFRSSSPQFDPDAYYASGLPEAIVEAVDPIVLASQVLDSGADEPDQTEVDLPQSILDQFDEALVMQGARRQLYVTLGQFTTVRLEQGAQLLIPVFESYVPDKECSDEQGEAEEPCEQFSRVEFPVDVFYPERCGGQSVAVEPGQRAAR